MLIDTALITAFFITLITESIVVLLFRTKPILLVISSIFLINSFTHPLFIGFGVHVFGVSIILSEIFIFIIEAFWYKFALQESLKKSVLISFAANTASLLVGFLFRLSF